MKDKDATGDRCSIIDDFVGQGASTSDESRPREGKPTQEGMQAAKPSATAGAASQGCKVITTFANEGRAVAPEKMNGTGMKQPNPRILSDSAEHRMHPDDPEDCVALDEYLSTLYGSWMKLFDHSVVEPQQAQVFCRSLFDSWRKVAEKTILRLDNRQTTLFHRLALDANDIHGAIDESYTEDERVSSLLYLEFVGLIANELPTFHMLFLTGQYRLVMSQLRFNWERIFHAWCADNEQSLATLDARHAWLTQQRQQKNKRNQIWPDMVGILKRLFGAKGATMTKLQSEYKQVWDRLNHCVHPSGELREKLIIDSRVQLLLRTDFDEAWARETLDDAAAVFGLIWLATLVRFRKAVPKLQTKPDLILFRSNPALRVALNGQ